MNWIVDLIYGFTPKREGTRKGLEETRYQIRLCPPWIVRQTVTTKQALSQTNDSDVSSETSMDFTKT